MVLIRNKKILSFIQAISFAALLFYPFTVNAQNVTQGYNTDEKLQRGMIVAIDEADTTKVKAVNIDNSDKVHGVVVSESDSVAVISEEGQLALVATTGKFEVLVSDQNGPIKAGDYVAVSSISGIGMKGDDKQPIIVGTALSEFSPGNVGFVLSKVTIKDSGGADKEINIGRISIDINIGTNPNLKVEASLPYFLKRASEAVAGKPVTAMRVYIGLAILIITGGISGSVIYSAIRSSIISIGRNPLSKKSILRGMLQIVMIGIMIFISGIVGVYLILRL